ncbi:GNAT family N-acetyltransferase [Bacillus sp. T33-2]|uniref:GNAT family N-acetyltransferase n=1 Tax=Bacillus sp. T33-2 TaxID=2054168 RepID=UPI000C78E216|nr:GNAT family N-acetyltransferase [Bacillus sp. T33-2]PLR94143.1 GNAT family N-acetyltransferase [Bacillus sp. T33-2]
MKIRSATIEDVKGIAKVHVDSWRSTYRGIVPDVLLDEELTYESREKQWTDHFGAASTDSILAVAEDEKNQIAGFISGGAERDGDPVYKGELYAIYILKEYQKQGLGQKLLLPLLDFLNSRDIDNMLVWVFRDNNSRGFYQTLGGKLYKEGEFEIGGAKVTEQAYAWDNITRLRDELLRKL